MNPSKEESYKIITTGERENGPLSANSIRDLYQRGLIDAGTLAFVPSKNQWLPLSQVFNLSLWNTSLPSMAVINKVANTATGSSKSKPSSNNIQQFAYKSKYDGVGGWLLLFVIGQLFYRPFATLSALSASFAGASARTRTVFPVTSFIISLSALLEILIAIFGIVVAVALIKVRDEQPVKWAKIFLLCVAGVSFLQPLMFYLCDLPVGYRENLIEKLFTLSTVNSIYVAIWYMYFRKSKRVRVTYLERDASGNEVDSSILSLNLN